MATTICDSKIYFSRDVKVYIKVNTGTGDEIWEIPVLDGFSFSQANNSSEVVLSEMENSLGVSRRGKKMFNDSLAPVEWSFSTYIRPFESVLNAPGQAGTATHVHAVEEILWALFAGPAQRTTLGTGPFQGTDWQGLSTDYLTFAAAEGPTVLDFSASNQSTLGTASIFFVLRAGELAYEITEAVVNEATINFDIDGIAMIEWSGLGSTIADSVTPTPTIFEAITSTTNFIRNRLTSMTVAPVKIAAALNVDTDASGVINAVAVTDPGSGYTDGTYTFIPGGIGAGSGAELQYIVSGGTVGTPTIVSGGTGYTNNLSGQIVTGLPASDSGSYTYEQELNLEDSYNLTLTGGSITLSNNISYITPEELGVVNVPFAHVTGTRSISGTFNNYVVLDTAATTPDTDLSQNFWEDLINLTTVVTQDFALEFQVGGSTGLPRIEFTMPHAHIEIPTHSIEDVISIETNFTALGSCISNIDELTLSYYAT